MGLLGADGGILWIIGGVWLVRRVWGADPGLAWAIGLLAAGFRWGTLSLGELQAGTRVLGPTVALEPTLAAVGSGLALVGALAEESAGGPGRSLPERAASAVVVLSMVLAFVSPGIETADPLRGLAWPAAAAVVVAVLLSGLRPLATRLPWWTPPTVSAAGVICVAVAR